MIGTQSNNSNFAVHSHRSREEKKHKNDVAAGIKFSLWTKFSLFLCQTLSISVRIPEVVWLLSMEQTHYLVRRVAVSPFKCGVLIVFWCLYAEWKCSRFSLFVVLRRFFCLFEFQIASLEALQAQFLILIQFQRPCKQIFSFWSVIQFQRPCKPIF